MEQYIVLKDRETGREYCAYTLRGSFPGELENTILLVAHENGIPAAQIIATTEERQAR